MSAIDIAEIVATEDVSMRLEKLVPLYNRSSEKEKFAILPLISKTAVMAKQYKDAKKYADELNSLANKYPDSWNYGNAIHDANIVLGMVELNNQNTNEAKKYLIKAGYTSGSPQMNSYGPNLMLAQALIDVNEKSVVVEYFTLVKNFWKNDDGRLDNWIETLNSGGKPYLKDYLDI